MGSRSCGVQGLDTASVSGFAAMANREDYDLLSIEVIESDIGSLAEFR